jgi:hypothetical protein
MALHLNQYCDQCGDEKPLVVGGGPEGVGDVVAFCIDCLQKTRDPEEVLDLIKQGQLG